jgi:hypothetical protein
MYVLHGFCCGGSCHTAVSVMGCDVCGRYVMWVMWVPWLDDVLQLDIGCLVCLTRGKQGMMCTELMRQCVLLVG